MHTSQDRELIPSQYCRKLPSYVKILEGETVTLVFTLGSPASSLEKVHGPCLCRMKECAEIFARSPLTLPRPHRTNFPATSGAEEFLAGLGLDIPR